MSQKHQEKFRTLSGNLNKIHRLELMKIKPGFMAKNFNLKINHT